MTFLEREANMAQTLSFRLEQSITYSKYIKLRI